jgi:hypothetical protein
VFVPGKTFIAQNNTYKMSNLAPDLLSNVRLARKSLAREEWSSLFVRNAIDDLKKSFLRVSPGAA